MIFVFKLEIARVCNLLRLEVCSVHNQKLELAQVEKSDKVAKWNS